MQHLLFIDPLEKLNFKKDSTLMMAHQMKQMGVEVYLLFEKDFYVSNQNQFTMNVYDFSSVEDTEKGFYLKDFKLGQNKTVDIKANTTIHMRIDPPFDTRYLRYLWMLRFYQNHGVKVVNSPDGILKFNEKLHAYSQPSSLASYVGSSFSEAHKFVQNLAPEKEFILKPLDLYQGYGVEKIHLDQINFEQKFLDKVKENNGAIVIQPFNRDVQNGEIRSLYFQGKELGSILKVPKQGEFLANIAQGASFHAIELNAKVKKECDRICAELMSEGVDWVAFDIMGDHVSEVNITCPGLLVEVSYAHHKNFAKTIIENLVR